jgi:hypothetical protein
MYAVSLSDKAGNVLSVPFTVTRDITAPTTPTNLRVNGGAGWITTSSTLVTWNATTDTQSGVAGYVLTATDGTQAAPSGTYPLNNSRVKLAK